MNLPILVFISTINKNKSKDIVAFDMGWNVPSLKVARLHPRWGHGLTEIAECFSVCFFITA